LVTCLFGDLEEAKEILKGIKSDLKEVIDARDENNQYTSLHYSIVGGHFALASYLVENGASTNFLDADGNNPLHLALKNGHSEIAKMLVKNGADIYKKDAQGKSPLAIAIYSQDTGCVEALCKGGADVLEIVNDSGDTPLHISAKMDLFEIANSLLKSNIATRHLKNKEGYTPSEVAKTGTMQSFIMGWKKGIEVSEFKNESTLASRTLNSTQKEVGTLIVSDFLRESDNSTINIKRDGLSEEDFMKGVVNGSIPQGMDYATWKKKKQELMKRSGTLKNSAEQKPIATLKDENKKNLLQPDHLLAQSE